MDISDEEIRRLLMMEYDNAEIRSGKFNRNPPILKSSNGIVGTVLTYSIECGTVFKDLAVLVLEDRIPVGELKKWVLDKVSRHLEEAVGIRLVDEVKVLYYNDQVRCLEDPPPPIIKILVEGVYSEEERRELRKQTVSFKEKILTSEFGGLKPLSEVTSSGFSEKSGDDQLKLEQESSSPGIIRRGGKFSMGHPTPHLYEVTNGNNESGELGSTKIAELLGIEELKIKIEKLEYLVEMLMRALIGKSPDTGVINMVSSALHHSHRPLSEQSHITNHVEAEPPGDFRRSEPSSHVLFGEKLSRMGEKEANNDAETIRQAKLNSEVSELSSKSDEFIEEFLVENPWAEILSNKKKRVGDR